MDLMGVLLFGNKAEIQFKSTAYSDYLLCFSLVNGQK